MLLLLRYISKMAERMEVDVPPEIDYLYPDLLSRDGLLYILRQRYINHTDLENQTKEELVELYNRYILPLPQRKYRNNRRGRDMTKKQILMSKKRKRNTSDDDADQPLRKKGLTDGPRSGLINQFSSPSSSGTRLKPPPSCINFEKKVVKLSSSTQVKSPAGNTLDSVVIKDFSKKVKLKTSSSASEESKSAGKAANEDGQQRKRLSNNHSGDSMNETTKDDKTDTSSSPKKISKITWP